MFLKVDFLIKLIFSSAPCTSGVPYPRHAQRDLPHKAHRGGPVPANVKKMNSPAAKVCPMRLKVPSVVKFIDKWY